jgi:hypothetical protein
MRPGVGARAWHRSVDEAFDGRDAPGGSPGPRHRFRPGAFLYLVVNQIVQMGDASARWIETEAMGKLGVTFRS